MRILITGGAGFIGSHTADVLRKSGHTVRILDNFSTGKFDNLREIGMKEDDDFYWRDITDRQAIASAFDLFRPEAVLHLAAQAAITTSMADPVKDCTINAIGTINVLLAALSYGVERFVFSSTSAVYKDRKTDRFFSNSIDENDALEPDSPYGVSKLAAEMYVRTEFSNHVILRYGNVYGPRQVPIGENQVIPRMIRHFEFGDQFFINGSGKQERDFVYVSDVARANEFALVGGDAGTYNIASGSSISVNEIAFMLEKIYDVPGYKWDHTEREDPRRKVCMDIYAAKNGLGWKPKVSIQDGLQETIAWWKGKK